MSVFKGFTLYEYSREYFVLLVKRGFEINNLWHKSRAELEKKLLEEKKKPQDEFKCECELGTFLCIYDAHSKSYFILLSNSKVQQEEQNALLKEIMEKIKQNNQISKMTREEFNTQYKKSITDILEQAELQFITKNGAIENITTQQTNNSKKFRKDIELEIKKKEEQEQRVQMTIEKLITKQISVQKEPPQKLIKKFMMFDLIRQYFFMVVNREKGISQKWLGDRNELQKYILEHQKKQESNFELKTENCTFYAKYNKEEKCYFIFYVSQIVSLNQIQDVIDTIYMQVSQTKKIANINKTEIENIYLKQIEIQLDKAESLCHKTVDINQISVIKETIDSKGQNPLIKSLSPQEQPIKPDNSKNHQAFQKNQNDETVPLNQ